MRAEVNRDRPAHRHRTTVVCRELLADLVVRLGRVKSARCNVEAERRSQGRNKRSAAAERQNCTTPVRSPLEPGLEVREARLASPMAAVIGRIPFFDGVLIIGSERDADVAPAEGAVVVIPAGAIRTMTAGLPPAASRRHPDRRQVLHRSGCPRPPSPMREANPTPVEGHHARQTVGSSPRSPGAAGRPSRNPAWFPKTTVTLMALTAPADCWQ